VERGSGTGVVGMRRPLVTLVLASVLWGGALTGTKYALRGFSPVTLLSAELVAAAGVLWAVLLVRGYRPTRSWWLPVLLGLLEPALAYLADTFGLSLTSAVDGAVISGLESALVVVMAAVLLGETVTAAAFWAVLVALGGLVVLAGAGGGHGTLAGDLLVAGGMLSGSLYTVVAKRFGDGSDVLSLTAWQFTVAAVASLPLTLVRWVTGAEAPPAHVAPRYWVVAMLVGIGGYGVSFLLFNQAIGDVDAGWAAVMLNLIPVFGFASAVVCLGEDVTRSEAVGALLIGSSVLYFTLADRRAARASPAATAGPAS
jgi:O-acetylserine/cysteine efflux transporter